MSAEHLKDHGISETMINKIKETAITPERADNNILTVNHNDVNALLEMMVQTLCPT